MGNQSVPAVAKKKRTITAIILLIGAALICGMTILIVVFTRDKDPYVEPPLIVKYTNQQKQDFVSAVRKMIGLTNSTAPADKNSDEYASYMIREGVIEGLPNAFEKALVSADGFVKLTLYIDNLDGNFSIDFSSIIKIDNDIITIDPSTLLYEIAMFFADTANLYVAIDDSEITSQQMGEVAYHIILTYLDELDFYKTIFIKNNRARQTALMLENANSNTTDERKEEIKKEVALVLVQGLLYEFMPEIKQAYTEMGVNAVSSVVSQILDFSAQTYEILVLLGAENLDAIIESIRSGNLTTSDVNDIFSAYKRDRLEPLIVDGKVITLPSKFTEFIDKLVYLYNTGYAGLIFAGEIPEIATDLLIVINEVPVFLDYLEEAATRAYTIILNIVDLLCEEDEQIYVDGAPLVIGGKKQYIQGTTGYLLEMLKEPAQNTSSGPEDFDARIMIFISKILNAAVKDNAISLEFLLRGEQILNTFSGLSSLIDYLSDLFGNIPNIGDLISNLFESNNLSTNSNLNALLADGDLSEYPDTDLKFMGEQVLTMINAFVNCPYQFVEKVGEDYVIRNAKFDDILNVLTLDYKKFYKAEDVVREDILSYWDELDDSWGELPATQEDIDDFFNNLEAAELAQLQEEVSDIMAQVAAKAVLDSIYPTLVGILEDLTLRLTQIPVASFENLIAQITEAFTIEKMMEIMTSFVEKITELFS